MSILQKHFGSIKMTWLKVMMIAVGSAIVSAFFLVCPGPNDTTFFRDTSFQNIGICFEAWILLAVFIIVNCEKWWEAMLKTFVFFLVSQPLIYLLQVPFAPLGWQIFMYYPGWFVWTLLTIPGSVIAWFVKKDNVASALILSVANVFLAFEFANHLKVCRKLFPKQLFAVVFILATIAMFIFCILKKKHTRIIAASIACIALIGLSYMELNTHGSSIEYIDNPSEWQIVETKADPGFQCEITNQGLKFKTSKYGKCEVTIQNKDGQRAVYTYRFDEGFNAIEHIE